MKKIVLSFLLIFISANLISQDKTLFESISKKYPNSSLIGISYKKNIELNIEDGKVNIVEKIKEETILLKEDARGYDNQSIYSNSFVKTKNIESTTYIPKGNNYKPFKNENIEVQNDNSSSSFYDDQKNILSILRNLKKEPSEAFNMKKHMKILIFLV